MTLTARKNAGFPLFQPHHLTGNGLQTHSRKKSSDFSDTLKESALQQGQELQDSRRHYQRKQVFLR